MTKLIVFDLDDTIIDTSIYKKIYSTVISTIKSDLNLTDELLMMLVKKKNVKVNSDNTFDTGDLCKKFGLLSMYYDILQKQINEMDVLNNDVEKIFLELKKQNYKIGIVSNSMRKTILLFLNRYNLLPYINFVFSSEETDYKKDNILFWTEFINKLDINPFNTIIIGDSYEDDIVNPKLLSFKTILIPKNDLSDVLELVKKETFK